MPSTTTPLARHLIAGQMEVLLDECRLEITLIDGVIVSARRFDFKAGSWTKASSEVLGSQRWQAEVDRALRMHFASEAA